ncbi:helix-turn-helix domain-containing protein [Sporosarcina sp. FSL K6-3457]|uniref:helix-turn-helix domain-containing protein n=1 Tax=Sporosarcina sp. FSL K6-3457 TaxID=2978204 RepID=UPI0030F6A925
MLPEKGLQIEKCSSKLEQASKKSLIEIREFIDQNYSEPLSIRQLAEMADISPKYFGDLFKKTFGQNVMNYLTDLRINQAKRYLAQTDILFRDIALKVGYSDEYYFSRKFKKEVGMSPSEFVKNSRKRLAVSTTAAMGQLLALDIIPIAAPLDPKWTPYYYNVYSTQIKSHLKLNHLNTNLKCEANLQKIKASSS